MNEQARTTALQYSLLALAAIALLAVVPALGMPNRITGALPAKLEPDDPDQIDEDVHIQDPIDEDEPIQDPIEEHP